MWILFLRTYVLHVQQDLGLVLVMRKQNLGLECRWRQGAKEKDETFFFLDLEESGGKLEWGESCGVDLVGYKEIKAESTGVIN